MDITIDIQFILEAIAVVTALIYIWLAGKENKWCFLFGFISSAIYVYMTVVIKLYFDTLINFYYVIMSVYGWLMWQRDEKQKPLAVSKLPYKIILMYSISGLLLVWILANTAISFTDSSYPYADAFTTVFAFIATYWVVKKYLENWLLWIVVDSVAAVIYFYKELYLTSILFVIYTFIAIFGYRQWKQSMKSAK